AGRVSPRCSWAGSAAGLRAGAHRLSGRCGAAVDPAAAACANGASRARTGDLLAASEALSQLSYSPGRRQSYRARRRGRGARSVARDELRHVQLIAGLAAAPAALVPARLARLAFERGALGGGDLVEARGHGAVRQAYVAQQPLGVVAKRHRELAQVAGDLGALREHFARDRVGVADDLARFFARVRAAGTRLLLGLLVEPDQLLAARRQQPLGVRACLLGHARGLGARVLEQLAGGALGLGAQAFGVGRGLGTRERSLLAALRAQALSGGAGVVEHARGLCIRIGERLRGLFASARFVRSELGGRGRGLASRRLRLRTRARQDLARLLLSGADAVLGGAVGFRDPLARPRL